MKKSIIVANWKMNGTKLSVQAWLDTLIGELSASPDSVNNTVSPEWVFCPPSAYVDLAVQRIKKASLNEGRLSVGAQNCHGALSGAFTGEVSANMLADLGCRYVLVGHSERRQLFGENNQMVAEKVRAVQEAGLIPILCVGETAEERQANDTQAVIVQQLEAVLNHCENKTNLLIAYEPLWAIGTGLTATPEQAQTVHHEIRAFLSKKNGEAVSSSLRLLYGGSVNPKNAAGLLVQPDIDGLLVGGASLKALDFIEIGRAVSLA
jgi:triosephosphate isomerase